jgi:DNA-binding CsgD family transcriptional regulator
MSAHPRERELQHFMLLDREEQRAAIHRLSAAGMSDYTIAAATMLSVEMIRAILGARKVSAT